MNNTNTTCDIKYNDSTSMENTSNTCDLGLLGNRQRLEVPTYLFSSQVIATVFFVFIFLLGVFGNLLVILVVCLNRNMKTSVNIYLINLCVADILVLTVCMPTVLIDVYARDVWYFGDTMCSLVPFLENTVVHASVLTLIAISVERYRVVCQPLRGICDNIHKNAKVVPFIWIISAASNLPWFYIAEFRDSRHVDGTPIKVCRLPIMPMWHTAYITLMCILFFVIPFLILLILYFRICYILHNTRYDISDDGSKNTSQCRHRRRLRAQVINIITSLILLFFVFHLPYRVVSLWFTFADKYEIHRLGIDNYFNLVYSVRILFYFNHAINPIIYNFVSSKFRNALRYTLTKRDRRGSQFSTNRRGNYNTPFIRPKHSQVILARKDLENNDLIHDRGCSSTTSSSRQNINEFYPMYANIIQQHHSDKYIAGSSKSNLVSNSEIRLNNI